MEFKLFIDKDRNEEVLVYAHEKNKLTDAIEQLCREDAFELVGYNDNGAVRLALPEIHCFIAESNKIFALTSNEKLHLKCRLYQLEENLPDGFVKINQSCIAHIAKIDRFDASLSGSLTVKFKNGYCDYVSRRSLKRVKERLGL